MDAYGHIVIYFVALARGLFHSGSMEVWNDDPAANTMVSFRLLRQPWFRSRMTREQEQFRSDRENAMHLFHTFVLEPLRSLVPPTSAS